MKATLIFVDKSSGLWIFFSLKTSAALSLSISSSLNFFRQSEALFINGYD